MHLGKNNPRYEYTIKSGDIVCPLSVTTCEKDLGVYIDPHLNFKEHIKAFAYAYLELKIPITPKVHCVIVHVPQFLALHPGLGLGHFSEQATEHLHSDLETFYQTCKYRRNVLTDPEFPQSFYKMCVAYNSKNEGDESSD